MILRIIVPNFPALGSGDVRPMPPTIIMSEELYYSPDNNILTVA